MFGVVCPAKGCLYSWHIVKGLWIYSDYKLNAEEIVKVANKETTKNKLKQHALFLLLFDLLQLFSDHLNLLCFELVAHIALVTASMKSGLAGHTRRKQSSANTTVS